MYTVARGEERYGPYTFDQLREYAKSGAVQPADLVWTPGMAAWSRVRELLGEKDPKPPSLHWAIVLVLAIVTWGFFALVWMFVHAVWIRRIDPASKALYVLSGGLALVLVVGFGLGVTGVDSAPIELLAQLGWTIAALVAYFDMRAAIEARYSVELSGIMTFFFNVLYLQYHLRRIAKGEHTPHYSRLLS